MSEKGDDIVQNTSHAAEMSVTTIYDGPISFFLTWTSISWMEFDKTIGGPAHGIVPKTVHKNSAMGW